MPAAAWGCRLVRRGSMLRQKQGFRWTHAPRGEGDRCGDDAAFHQNSLTTGLNHASLN